MADTPKSFFLTKPVHDYLVAHAPPLDDVQRDLIAETEALGGISMMQIAPEQGAFMTLLTRLIGAPPAIETLRSLPAAEQFDLAFIDADKPNYPHYYEEVLARLRRNGVILVDNTLWGGAVADSKATDDNTNAIRAFNDAVAADDRVESTILTVGDGLTLIRKR